MKITRPAPSLALVAAVGLGLALIAGALVSGSDWAVLIGLAGLLLAGKAALTLARRSGASDQPQ